MDSIETIAIILAGFVAFILAISILYPPLWRDLYTISIVLKVFRNTKKDGKEHTLIVDRFESQAQAIPERTFIIFKEEKFSYGFVDKKSNKVARSIKELGVNTGDTVAIVMSNEPAFIWIYLGVQKVGAKIALVNHHLPVEGLLHTIASCSPKLVIVGDGLSDYLPRRVAKLQTALSMAVYCYNPCQDESLGLPCFSDTMEQASDDPFDTAYRRSIKLSDAGAFIFTSGTTGLPKPAIISHKKLILCSHCFSPVGFSSDEILYLTLPLYHASGINLALLNVIAAGATILLREKFSVSHFWEDCLKYKVTCFMYIGEMLRYLVNAPESAAEKKHNIRYAIGNGLRQDIWSKFEARFKVPHIYEFYGSTELPANLTNYFNVKGSVGRLSPLLSKLTSQILVKVDPDTGKPLRNEQGRCEPIKPGCRGILLAKLSDRVNFDGYLGPAAETTSRILKDVFEDGDFYVNTNDVFEIDSHYNLFFNDRIGDSFRWKGENVSTAEVSNVMNTAQFIQDTNVFGVEIPGCEGKAGMAAVNLKDDEELDSEKIDELGKLCEEKLPGYARPRFLRFQRQMSLTSTFKQQKTDLAREGFNPNKVNEPLYFLERSTNKYMPLDDDIYHKIVQKELQF